MNAKILFSYGKNNANESRENIKDCALELSQLPLYNINSLRAGSISFVYKNRLDEKIGESNFESTEECYQHLVKCIHQAAKEALGEKTLRSKTKPFYYWNEEIGQITEEKNKSWKKTCSTVESYLGGKRRREAWRILKNLRKN